MSRANRPRSPHRLYDRITSDAPEYYLFPDELNLLKTHGDAIARSMGFPGRSRSAALFSPEVDDETKETSPPLEDESEDGRRRRTEHVLAKPWKPARWGDSEVGRWNNGVNGEQGFGGGWERGYDLVELGAGRVVSQALLQSADLQRFAQDSLPPHRTLIRSSSFTVCGLAIANYLPPA